MMVVWGKLAGLILGAFGGLVGAAFGLLVGHLLDVVAGEFLLRRAVDRFLAGPDVASPRWFDRSAAAAALAVAAVVDAAWSPTSNDTEAFARAAGVWISELTPDRPEVARAGFAGRAGSLLRRTRRRIGRGRPGRYLDAALRMRAQLDISTVGGLISTEVDANRQGRVIEICRATLDTRFRGRARDNALELARTIGLSDEWIDRTFASGESDGSANRIDPEACRILEVSPEADLDEVKRAYRRLASHFHPDTAEGLSPQQRDASSAAFVRIRETYERIVSQLTRDG